MANGQALPIHADREGLVWAGRTMLNICLDLGLTPKVDVVDDGYAAAVTELATRDLSILETADLVAAVKDDLSAKFALNEEKWSHEVSLWFRDHMGKERGYSPRQIEKYLRLARATPEQRSQVDDQHTLHAAISALDSPRDRRTRKSSKPMNLEEQLVGLAESLATVEQVGPDLVALLQGIRTLIDEILIERQPPDVEVA